MEATATSDVAGKEAHDWIAGAGKIGDYLFPDIPDPRARRRKVYHLIDRGLLPVVKLGGCIRARRSRLRQYIIERENASLSNADA
jgi:hypothetical protein